MPFVTVAASLVINPSFSADSDSDTWVFNGYCGPSSSSEQLGVGDTIVVYQYTLHMSSIPTPSPIFTATITHIVGWGGGHVKFGVHTEATAGIPTYQGPCTICLPLRICRLFWWQRLWGWIFPFPRLSVILQSQ
ncbi:hypothetical protein BDR07DRAFT_1408115 [Suillus spraguei]|nr:hypothetical protein BDR07DRAFT_1408115 [Suillus spraguei]